MNRRLRPQRRAGNLAAAVGDHLVDVHVELRAAAGHPHMQREHVVVLAGQDLVADLDNEPMHLVVETLAGMVGVGRRLLQDGEAGHHLARDQVLADAEMLERALGLRAPQRSAGTSIRQAVGFSAGVGHRRRRVRARRRRVRKASTVRRAASNDDRRSIALTAMELSSQFSDHLQPDSRVRQSDSTPRRPRSSCMDTIAPRLSARC
jgi:hypothetical protein